MVIQRNASKWPWTVDTNTSECNTEANAGLVTQSESTVREQTQNVT